MAALQRLPGVGARSAPRLANHMLKTPREDVDALCDAMRSVKENITYCSVCSNMTAVDPCIYCSSSERDSRLICVVEQPENVAAIEKTRGFRGRYHVLMGAIAPLQGVGPDELKIRALLLRIAEADAAGTAVKEVILATNPTVEGEATALYLARLLKPLGLSVTRIAMGMPVGGDIDYTDEFTMSKAMEGRREM